MYFDNSATTLHKPASLKEKYIELLESESYGNPSRSGHVLSQNSMMGIYKTKMDLAKIFHIGDPNDIALTENASFGLNMIIKSLVKENDHVITTTTEHNSVLRPLYQSGAGLSFLDFDENCEVDFDKISELIKENTRFIVTNHASNLLANLNDLDKIHEIAHKYNLVMIIDMAQTAGCVDVDLSKYTNSIFVFTGHKSLYGPSGTGGIIKVGDFDFSNVFAGGSGVNSFDKCHPKDFPAIFEVGTSNFLSQIAMDASLKFLLETGIENINEKIKKLTKRFYEGIENIEGIKIYSKKPEGDFTGIVSFNLSDMDSSEFSLILDEKYEMQTRPGAHCAPLIHKHFGTENQGIVRFSFSYFNTEEEIDAAIKAVKEIAEDYNNK
ncbi:aminotransferase class V-fold PLP-dependent enzyme [Anaerococcus sp. Marseille-Q5996]|uniref:aminotransferase class V-fold PLP-dependent enzyme n=1 Tax=Anaerococcus sp. Marseille-Q5996 TaxID=2972769 RepID=UPI0021C9D063|nr:aminotransferase class V-fold PLP-dependent enzyme [Anaerococcus sp. Marseille-Q5996]